MQYGYKTRKERREEQKSVEVHIDEPLKELIDDKILNKLQKSYRNIYAQKNKRYISKRHSNTEQ